MKKLLKWCFVGIFGLAIGVCIAGELRASQGVDIPMGPITGGFDMKNTPCPNCGEVGNLVKVNEINGILVKNTYCCLSCFFCFEVVKN